MRTGFQPNNYDLLRLFAEFQVVFIHSVKELQLKKKPAYDLLADFHGGSIFFILSGFLISAAWERNRDIVNFVKNRTLLIFTPRRVSFSPRNPIAHHIRDQFADWYCLMVANS